MDTKYLFYITLVISIIVQIITGIIEIGAFFVKVPTMYLLIKQLLLQLLHFFVQLVTVTHCFWLLKLLLPLLQMLYTVCVSVQLYPRPHLFLH